MIVFFWICFSFLAAWIAADKGRSGVGFFFLSLLLSPLIGIIAACACQGRRDSIEQRLARLEETR